MLTGESERGVVERMYWQWCSQRAITAVTSAKVCVIDADKSCSVDAHDPKSKRSMTFKISELCDPAEGRSTHPQRSLGLQDLRCR